MFKIALKTSLAPKAYKIGTEEADELSHVPGQPRAQPDSVSNNKKKNYGFYFGG